MEVSITTAVWHDDGGWHYFVKAYEESTLLIHITGDFERGAKLENVQNFCSWIVGVIVRPRMGDDPFAPPAYLQAGMPRG